VQDRCLEEEPPLTAADAAGHRFRCWFPVGTPAGKEALAKNERDGRVPTAAAVTAVAAAGGA
jgi:peptide/nickel transport system ATP-binding protein